MFDFLWSGKSAKIARKDSFNTLKQGGLSMVDVDLFWQSLKCSWIRRLVKTEAFWPKILSENLGKIGANVNNILCEVPNSLLLMSKKISNFFWKNVLKALANLLNKACFIRADSFFLFPIFSNPVFRFDGKMLDRKKYNGLPQKISSVADFYKNKDQLYTVDEFNALYDLNFPSNQLDRIHQSINTAIHNLNSPKCNWQSRPRQSFVLKIALKQQKGCRSFYDILRSTPGHQSS